MCISQSLLIITPAKADIIVINSTSKIIEVGRTIPLDSHIQLIKNDEVRIMDTSTGQTRVLVGPFTGSISDYISHCNKQLDCTNGNKVERPGATRSSE